MNRLDDEAMLRDINHVSHRDGMREGVWAFCLVGLFWLVALGAFPPPVHPILRLFGTFVMAAYADWWVKRRIARAAALPRHTPEIVSRRSHEFRAAQEAETRRKIDEAKASAAFDRWDSSRTG